MILFNAASIGIAAVGAHLLDPTSKRERFLDFVHGTHPKKIAALGTLTAFTAVMLSYKMPLDLTKIKLLDPLAQKKIFNALMMHTCLIPICDQIVIAIPKYFCEHWYSLKRQEYFENDLKIIRIGIAALTYGFTNLIRDRFSGPLRPIHKHISEFVSTVLFASAAGFLQERTRSFVYPIINAWVLNLSLMVADIASPRISTKARYISRALSIANLCYIFFEVLLLADARYVEKAKKNRFDLFQVSQIINTVNEIVSDKPKQDLISKFFQFLKNSIKEVSYSDDDEKPGVKICTIIFFDAPVFKSTSQKCSQLSIPKKLKFTISKLGLTFNDLQPSITKWDSLKKTSQVDSLKSFYINAEPDETSLEKYLQDFIPAEIIDNNN